MEPNVGSNAPVPGAEQERWLREADFFDAEEYSEGPIPEITVRRYQELKGPFLPAEHSFAMLGDLKGKRVLELGCGDGGNAILLALKGAEVYGVDVSARAIEIAKKRASMHGVSKRTHFDCMPLELYTKSQTQPFDIICGWAVLHHVLPVLDGVLADLNKLARKDTIFVFSEPVNQWDWLRKLRLALPISCHGTPDERPLDSRDFVILRNRIPNLRVHYFGAVIRVVHRFLPSHYENFSAGMRFFYHACVRFDNIILNVLGIHGLGSTATIYTK